jgi:peptide/nickel transport system ATP-binding protein
MTAAPILEVNDVVKHFPVRTGLFGRTKATVRAVDGVSFSLTEGETFGLVGESGCGKSTLVKAILLLERPTQGEIRFRGETLTTGDANRLRRQIQIVFQDPYQSLPPRMTVGDIVADPMRIHKLGDRETIAARVRHVLQEVGLNPDRSAQYPFQFSGGQRQRIGIARALAVAPSVLLLDESVSALDVSVQAQVLNLMRRLQDELGLTYLFISHDLSVVRQMSDRIAVMYLGRIVEEGDTEELFAQPRHPYTRLLLQTIPNIEAPNRNREPASGEVPSPLKPPSGCAFHPRCPIATARCSKEVPTVRVLQNGTRVACHLAEDVIAERLPEAG